MQFMIICLFSVLLSSAFAVFNNCPEFEYKTLANKRLAFTVNPVTSSWDEASRFCRMCLGGYLADITNAMVVEENNNIRSYWIGHYDGGALVPNLVWYTGSSPAVTVIPSTLTANRGFVCTDFQYTGSPFAVALLVDYQPSSKTLQKKGEIRFFQQDSDSLLQIVLTPEKLSLGNYLLRVDLFGDLTLGCQYHNLLDRNLSVSLDVDDEFSNVTVKTSVYSLFGFDSILGRLVVLENEKEEIIACGVIGFGNTILNPIPTSSNETEPPVIIDSVAPQEEISHTTDRVPQPVPLVQLPVPENSIPEPVEEDNTGRTTQYVPLPEDAIPLPVSQPVPFPEKPKIRHWK